MAPSEEKELAQSVCQKMYPQLTEGVLQSTTGSNEVALDRERFLRVMGIGPVVYVPPS